MAYSDPWNVAIFSSRETPELLLETIRAVVMAERPIDQAVRADVLINGNATLSASVCEQLNTIGMLPPRSTVRIWQIAQPDKAHTWNTYVHNLWPGGSPTFFVDGYAAVDPPSLRRIVEALSSKPLALSATCVPRMGPSARSLRRQLETHGGIQGNLYALSKLGMQRLRAHSFKLPAGIYRTDPTLYAVLCVDFDPAVHAWDRSNVIVVGDASYAYQTPSLLRIRDLRSYLRRHLRQAQGLVETRAVRHHLVEMRRLPRDLPDTAYDLMSNWCSERPTDAKNLFRRSPLSYWAYRGVLKRGRPNWPDTPPKLVREWSTN